MQSLTDTAKLFEPYLAKGRIVTAESHNRNVTYSSVGSKDPENTQPQNVIFEIGSITKVFNGLLFAQSIVEGRLSLDSQIQDLLPDLNFKDSRLGCTELRHLATHSSGLPDFPNNFFEPCDPYDPYAHYHEALFRDWLKEVQLQGEAPFPLNYSNFGAALLGMVLTRIYRKSWEELIREKITQPLDMMDTLVNLSDEQEYRFAPAHLGETRVKPMKWTSIVGAGGLKSTAKDLMKFGQTLLFPKQNPLNQAIKLMLSPQEHMQNMGLGIFTHITRQKSFDRHK